MFSALAPKLGPPEGYLHSTWELCNVWDAGWSFRSFQIS